MRGASPGSFVLSSTLACVLLAIPGAAAAAPTRQACVAAYEETQTLMRRSRLNQARASLQTCLDEACPAMLRSDCAGWLKEVEARTASVVVEVVVDGVAVREARLSIDGQLKEKALDGRAMEVDPGSHTFRAELAGGKEVTLEAVVREGEKLKLVRLEFAGPKPAPSVPPVGRPLVPPPAQTETRRPVPWAVYAGVGVGALGLAGFGFFAASGSSDKSDLEPCRPECSASRISDVRTQFIVADVLLGVSVLALGAAAYFYFTRPMVSSSRARAVGAQLAF